MSYRDGLEASQARADALEQELGDAQEQIRTLEEELKKRDAPPTPEPPVAELQTPALEIQTPAPDLQTPAPDPRREGERQKRI